MPQNKKLEIPSVLWRTFSVRTANIDAEKRTLDLSFSSEEPYDRGWGIEILDHTKASIRMDRLNGGANLLYNHNRDDLLGVVEKAKIVERRGTATVRFSKSALGEEKFMQAQEGVLHWVSVGYEIHALELESEKDGVSTYRVTDWEPLEISLVTIPADPTVGVGRAADGGGAGRSKTITLATRGKQEMPEGNSATPPATGQQININEEREQARNAERKRMSEIRQLGVTYKDISGTAEIVEKALAEDVTVQEVQLRILEQVGKAKKLSPADTAIDVPKRDLEKYSIVRAAARLVRGLPVDGLELELSTEFARKTQQIESRGFYIPPEVMQYKRTMSVTGDGGVNGGAGVMTTYGGFIEQFREGTILSRLGANVITGLQGNVVFVKQNGQVVSYWVGETEDASLKSSTIGMDPVSMTPHRHTAFVAISDKLLLQSTPDVEAMVRTDLFAALGEAFDQSGISGDGTGENPKGILHADNHYNRYAGSARDAETLAATNANGAALTFADVVFMSRDLRNRKTRRGNLAYLTNPSVQSQLTLTQRFANTDSPVWQVNGTDPDIGIVNGMRAGVSGLVPDGGTKGTGTNLSTIILGNFGDLIMASWGGAEILVDPYTAMGSGIYKLYARMYGDILIRRKASFVAIGDVVA